MRRNLDRYRPRPLRDCPRDVEILIGESVFSHILREMGKHVSQEEGGKYIGYIFTPGTLQGDGIHINPRAHAILITDFLPSGPKAVRTAVEFRPDGEYQDRLFRKIEAEDPAIEHLGTWHSHHCNGVLTLSPGDVDGYFRTIAKPAFRLDYFVASLVKYVPSGPLQEGWIDHFLFVRGLDDYYIATDSVRIVDLPPMLEGEGPRAPREGSASRLRAISGRRARPVANHWYETEEGRRVLADDRRLFGDQFGDDVVATRRGAQITLTGRLGETAISLTYPEKPGDQKTSASVRSGAVIVLEMSCELRYRRVAFAAALAAAAASRDVQG